MAKNLKEKPANAGFASFVVNLIYNAALQVYSAALWAYNVASQAYIAILRPYITAL